MRGNSLGWGYGQGKGSYVTGGAVMFYVGGITSWYGAHNLDNYCGLVLGCGIYGIGCLEGLMELGFWKLDVFIITACWIWCVVNECGDIHCFYSCL